MVSEHSGVKQSLSTPFSIGVKQGCLLASRLLSILSSVLLQQTNINLDVENCVYICFRTDCSIFTLRRLKLLTITSDQLICKHLLADDAALIAQTEEALSQFSESSGEYKALIDVEGYQDLGYMGLARVEELQGNRYKVLDVYEQYLSTMDAAATLQKVIVDEKIARIKASQ